MKAWIKKYKTISILDSFDNGILPVLGNSSGEKIIEPDYKKIISPNLLRRMSKVVRMGVATALSVNGEEEPDGIIVGTGLGCFDNSIVFSEEFMLGSNELLSPSSFIQSTDNTIAGQIGQLLKNNGYNITFTHKGLAFETALMDALLFLEEGNGSVLIGAVDQNIDMFQITDPESKHYLGEGSSFFILSKEKNESTVMVSDCNFISLENDSIVSNLKKILPISEPKTDLILYGDSFLNRQPAPDFIGEIPVIDYSKKCGIYFTNPAFAMQIAAEILSKENPDFEGRKIRHILIANNFNDRDMGYIRISKEK